MVALLAPCWAALEAFMDFVEMERGRLTGVAVEGVEVWADSNVEGAGDAAS